MTEHLDDEILASVAGGTLSDSLAANVVQHLLHCDPCGERFDRLLRGGEENEISEYVLSDSLRRQLRLRAADQLERRSEAKKVVAELVSGSTHARQTVVRNSRRVANSDVALGLIAEARARIFEDPQDSLSLAALALEIAEGLSRERPSEIHTDVLALAWIEVANARRVLGDFSGASEAIHQGLLHLEQGSGEPSHEASYLEVLCAFQWEQREYSTALRTNGRLVRLRKDLGQKHTLGKALLMRALILSSSSAEGALEAFESSISLLDGDQEPQAYAAAHLNLAVHLERTGDRDSAVAVLSRGAATPAGSAPVVRAHLRWLEGRLHRAAGMTTAAERCLSEATASLLDLGKPVKAAEAALELGTLLFELRRFSEVRELAARTLPIFKSQGIHREALAAYTLFVQAAEAETLTQALLTELTQYFGQFKPREARPFRPTGSTG